MSRRHALLVAGLAVSLTLVAPLPASPAVVAAVVPATGQVIEGWTGGTPATVGVGIDRDNGVTAAFTSTTGDRTDLWVADRSPGGAWAGAVQMAADVDAGTADFAENRSGAAVLAWDAPAADGRTELRTSFRGSALSAWSTPSTVVSDADLSHRVSVGMEGGGAATLAYAHDAGQGVTVRTQRHAAGAWEPAVEHAVTPVRQIELAVGGNGYATIAWTQDDDGNVTLHVRRFLASTRAWQPAQLMGSGIAPQGLIDLAVNNEASTALDYYRSNGRGGYQVWRVHSFLMPSSSGSCTEDCSKWHGEGTTASSDDESRPPSAAVTVTSNGSTTGVHSWPVGDGTRSLHAQEMQGEGHGHSVEVAPPGDNDHLTAVSDGFRTLATWVTHTAAGDRLFARTVAAPNNDVLADPQITSLGAVSGPAVSALGPDPHDLAVVVWPDTTVQPAVLRSASTTVFYPYFQEIDVIAAMVSPTVEFNHSIQVPAQWSSKSAGPQSRYDVRTRQANARLPFSGPYAFRTHTAETSARLQAVRGRTVCFSAREVAGDWSGERCTAVAVDDTALTGRYWKRDRYTPFYGLSRLATARKGARLTISAIRARSIALLVSRSLGNGRVQVKLGRARPGDVPAGRTARAQSGDPGGRLRQDAPRHAEHHRAGLRQTGEHRRGVPQRSVSLVRAGPSGSRPPTRRP